eukprot:g27734.t1
MIFGNQYLNISRNQAVYISHIHMLTILKYGVKSMFFAIGSQIAVPGDSSRILSSTICSARICSIAFASHQQFCTGSHSVSSTASTSSSYVSNKFLYFNYIVCLAIQFTTANYYQYTYHQTST